MYRMQSRKFECIIAHIDNESVLCVGTVSDFQMIHATRNSSKRSRKDALLQVEEQLILFRIRGRRKKEKERLPENRRLAYRVNKVRVCRSDVRGQLVPISLPNPSSLAIVEFGRMYSQQPRLIPYPGYVLKELWLRGGTSHADGLASYKSRWPPEVCAH